MPPSPPSPIRYAPTDGLTYNPNDPKYWDRRSLDQEVHRTFDLCNGCRLCFRFCQSFPTLFDAVDEAGDVRELPEAKVDQVVDECFQCKLCYTNCPYTEAEGHEFKIDFPRLIMRANAIRRKTQGLPLRERLLADPDRIGRLGTAMPALANWGNTLKPNRVLMEKTIGIHRDKRLPMFAGQPFAEWVTRETDGRGETDGSDDRVVLMPTCYVNWNKPELGQAAWRVLRHNECTVACPELRCCGMPALDGGDVPAAIRQARENVKTLRPYVERGYRIGVINPTCSLMLKQEYPELLDDPADPAMAEAARRVAAGTRDLGELLHELRVAGRLKEDFRSTPAGPVACHAPCHLRKQNVGFRGRDLIRRIPQAKPQLVAECCGHDGTWAMKTENFPLAMKNGRKSFDGMQEVEADVWATECPLAALQFGQACGREVLHPVEILDRAYREDGFATKIAPAAMPNDGQQSRSEG
ncbi:MAG TPA: heterodisulfide reductase-related iron-sulfur binding cluster [Vicinamibacterales bacterium]